MAVLTTYFCAYGTLQHTILRYVSAEAVSRAMTMCPEDTSVMDDGGGRSKGQAPGKSSAKKVVSTRSKKE